MSIEENKDLKLTDICFRFNKIEREKKFKLKIN